jgi:hypothetical protein
MVDNAVPSAFFAYAGSPALRAEVMRDAARGLNQRGQSASTWEDLPIDGTLLIMTICERIDACQALVAEVSSMNPNVLFEVGYAVARNKPIWWAYDESDTEAERLWNEVGLFSTIGRTEYGGNAEILIAKYFKMPPFEERPLAEILLAGANPRESNAVFAPSLPTRISAAAELESLLERQSHLKILGSSEDLIIAPLGFYVREIYRSSAVILHLLGSQRRRSQEHNARVSFLAGFAYGLDLPLLMVVESGYDTPLDFRDLLFEYDTSAMLQEKVKAWLDAIPKTPGTQRRLGRMTLDIELPIRTFGQYVAEYEIEELSNYFIPTNEFAAVVAGDAQIYTGRKGTGKTATMSQVTKDLRLDRRNLVVPIKPSSYELRGLIELSNSLGAPAHSEYLLMTIWMYLIYTEIALRTVETESAKPVAVVDRTSVYDLEQLLRTMEVSTDEDLSARLERIVGQVAAELKATGSSDHDEIARLLRTDHLNRLRVLTVKALGDYSRVAVLIDNLDKNWERGVDYEMVSRFILSLLTTAGKVEKEFAKTSTGDEPLKVTLALFLRTDIYDVVRTYAREPDKIGARTVDWDDEQLLVRVLEERYAVNRMSKRSAPVMWEELFCPEVRGHPTRDYFLWRALRRPRDFVYFANASLTTAINRGHHIVEPTDITYAEREYSRFAIEALLVESESRGFDLEELLYEFAGLGATLSESELTVVLAGSSQPAAVRDWLVAASFLGVEKRAGEYVYVEGETSARRKMKVAARGAKLSEKEIRFRVHPAFRPFLEITDDDLHH